MPYFLVTIQGSRPRGAGLLAVQGVQNVVGPDGALLARLRADDAEAAAGRVADALEGEPFEVGEAKPEGVAT